MSILFFDTETTGLYINKLQFDHPDQPGLVQFAAKLTKDDGTPISTLSLIVNPARDIPERAVEVHGITTEFARRFGVSEKTAYGHYMHMRKRADLIVAHNAKFDLGVMLCVAARLGFDTASEPHVPTFCTMETAAPIVNLPPTDRMRGYGIDKPKPPKLEECIKHFFNEDFEGAHDALFDVGGCERVYFHLKSIERSKT